MLKLETSKPVCASISIRWATASQVEINSVWSRPSSLSEILIAARATVLQNIQHSSG